MKWISVKDQLPPSAGYYECKSYFIWRGFACVAYYYNDEWIDDPDGWGARFSDVTHWMPVCDPTKIEIHKKEDAK